MHRVRISPRVVSQWVGEKIAEHLTRSFGQRDVLTFELVEQQEIATKDSRFWVESVKHTGRAISGEAKRLHWTAFSAWCDGYTSAVLRESPITAADAGAGK